MTKEDLEFIDGLSSFERLLILINNDIYEGDWGKMEKDLQDRLESEPIPKPGTDGYERIEDDLDSIRKIRDYEKVKGVRLMDYLKSELTPIK